MVIEMLMNRNTKIGEVNTKRSTYFLIFERSLALEHGLQCSSHVAVVKYTSTFPDAVHGPHG